MSELTQVVPGTYKAVISQLLGLITDAFDLTVIVAMTPILSAILFPPSNTPLFSAFGVILAYSLTVVFRPVGGAIFGHLGDRIGRIYSLMVTIGGIGVSAAAVALIPPYAQIGVWSYILFLICRIILGTFYGGEYAGGLPYVIEWTPPRWRGLVSGIIMCGWAVGLMIASVVVGALTGLIGDAAMIAYGWRYIFASGLIPVAVALFIRFKLRETPIFETLKKTGKTEKAPLLSLFKKPTVFSFVQVMGMMTGLQLYAAGIYYMPTMMTNKPGIVGTSLSAFILSISGGAQIVFTIVYGALSQRIGRRRLGMAWAAVGFVIALPMYYGLIQAAAVLNIWLLAICAMLIGIMAQAPFGALAAYLSERFKTSLRSSGVGFGYASGFFIGAWYSLYVPALHTYAFQGIETSTNIWLSVSVLGMISALLYGIAFYFGPETGGKRLTEEAPSETSTPK